MNLREGGRDVEKRKGGKGRKRGARVFVCVYMYVRKKKKLSILYILKDF